MNSRYAVCLFALLLFGCAHGTQYGPIPDVATAIKVGCNVIAHSSDGAKGPCPDLSAKLDGDRWIVSQKIAEGHMGIASNVILSKSDGRVLVIILEQ